MLSHLLVAEQVAFLFYFCNVIFGASTYANTIPYVIAVFKDYSH